MEASDWASLPSNILLDVFLRLGPREVMLGAEFACKPWRSVALEEPSLWRRVGMDLRDPLDERLRHGRRTVEKGTRLIALDRAKGQCEAFEGYCNDDDVLDLVGRAPSLESFNIEYHGYYYDEPEQYLIEALQKLTLLEELRIHFKCRNDPEEDILQSVCEVCPRLKKLVLMYASCSDLGLNEADSHNELIDGPIPVMHRLHTLELYDCELTSKGLEAILDSCPLLETLYIDGYFDKREMGKELRLKCTRVKNLTLDTRNKSHNLSEYDYGGYYSSEEDSEISSLEDNYESDD